MTKKKSYKGKENSGDLASVPDEIIEKHIVPHLTSKAVASLCQTNKWGSLFFSQEKFWEKFCAAQSIRVASNFFHDSYVKAQKQQQQQKSKSFLVIATRDSQYKPRDYLKRFIESQENNNLFLSLDPDSPQKNNNLTLCSGDSLKKLRFKQTAGQVYVYEIQGLTSDQALDHVKKNNYSLVWQNIVKAFSLTSSDSPVDIQMANCTSERQLVICN